MIADNLPLSGSGTVREVLDHPHARRLAQMGIRPGAAIRALGRTSGGGRILLVDDARIAVDRDTLRSIEVTG